MIKTLLWLDDARDPMENDWLNFSPIGKNVDVHWVTTYQEFVDWIMCNGLPDAICFDHDLGTNNGNGMGCATWLVNYCLDTKNNLPKYAIQSANPVGKQNINSLLENFSKHFANTYKHD